MGLLEDAIREHLELKRRHGANADEVAKAERDALGPPGRPTPLEDTAAAHAAETPPAARHAPEAGADPFDLGEDEPAAVREDELEEPATVRDYELDEPAAVREGELEEPAAVRDDSFEEPAAVGDDELLEADVAPRPYAVEPLEEDVELFTEEEEAALLPPAVEPQAPAYEPPEAAPAPVEPEAAPDAPTRITTATELDAEPPPEPPLAEPPPEPPVGAPAPTTVEDAPPAEPPEGDVEAAPGEDESTETGEDVLEETPEFLQETPEHDRLWFEQKPPRDFDFGS